MRLTAWDWSGRSSQPTSVSCTVGEGGGVQIHFRASEQWNLRWSDIDLERKTLTIRRQKSKKGERHIRLNQVAINSSQSIRKKTGASAVPFLNSKGTPMNTHGDWFDPAVIEGQDSREMWHKNRHTFASRLAMAGVDIRTIAQLMGHGTTQTFMRYAHLSPDHNQSAVDRVVGFESQGTKTDTGKTTEMSCIGLQTIALVLNIKDFSTFGLAIC